MQKQPPNNSLFGGRQIRWALPGAIAVVLENNFRKRGEAAFDSGYRRYSWI